MKDYLAEHRKQKFGSKAETKNWINFYKNTPEGISPIDWLEFAVNDYIGCRALMWIGILEPAHILAEQCIEKSLKGHLCEKYTGSVPKKYNHELSKIIQDLPELDLSPGDRKLITKLQKSFEVHRYPDTEKKHLSSSEHFFIGGSIIQEIDGLFLKLLLTMPVQTEILFRTNFFSYLFNDFKSPSYFYLILQNEELSKIQEELKDIYFNVRSWRLNSKQS